MIHMKIPEQAASVKAKIVSQTTRSQSHQDIELNGQAWKSLMGSTNKLPGKMFKIREYRFLHMQFFIQYESYCKILNFFR